MNSPLQTISSSHLMLQPASPIPGHLVSFVFRILRTWIIIWILYFPVLTLLRPLTALPPLMIWLHYITIAFPVFNSLAPVKTWTVSFSHTAPWFTSELRTMKAKGRQLERLYRKSGLSIHKELYKAHILLYKDSISHAKFNYYSGLICANTGNTKLLFSLLNRILQPPDSFPPHFYSVDTCNSLMQFFTEKIQNIHQQLRPGSLTLASSELFPPSLFCFPSLRYL